MAPKLVGIIILNGKAYIPSLAETTSGMLIQIDPIIESEIQEDKLVEAINKILLTPRPQIPDISRDEWKKRKDPVLKATKVRSWKELAIKGASIGLEWTNQGIKLDIPKLDKKEGRWEVDPTSEITFPISTPLRDIVRVVIEKINSFPNMST